MTAVGRQAWANVVIAVHLHTVADALMALPRYTNTLKTNVGVSSADPRLMDGVAAIAHQALIGMAMAQISASGAAQRVTGMAVATAQPRCMRSSTTLHSRQ